MPMDKIMLLILFSIIGSVTKGNAQLQCFVCNNCPNPNELDTNVIQTCGTPDTTTTTDPVDTTIPTDQTSTEEPPTTTSEIPIEPTTTTPEIPIEPTTTTTQIPVEPPTTQTTEDGGITTPTLPITPPSTTPQIPVSPPDLLGYKYRQVMRQLVGEYQCFVLHRQVGDAVQVNRGCVVTQETEEQTCFDANAGVDPEFCRLCPYNECNIASKYAVSLIVVLSSLFVVSAIR